ncbi:MAG TPA: efflux RND transporter periplasmic adaptor subunit [Clostridia bacterium]|nr:efflux RND transporter periplasmic adaptor subunit [Clostridia bacterium]
MRIRDVNDFGYLPLVAIIATALLLGGCAQKGTTEAKAAPPASPAKVLEAKAQRVPEYTEYIGTMKSRNSSVLQPEVEGQITEILVSAGDEVRAGQPLLEIDPRKQQATVHSQEATRRSKLAALAFNHDELERRKKLHAAGVISRQELDQAQTAYEASVADVDALGATVREQRVQLRYFTVKAPASGTIGDIPVRVGDRVTNSTLLTTLDKGGELELYVSIPSENSSKVRVGTPVDIVDDAGASVVRSKVTFVSPRVDPQTQLLLLKAQVPNAKRLFRNNQVVHVRVVWSELERPVIPVTAISLLNGQTFAFVAEKQGDQFFARQRAIRVGDIVGNDFVVLDGIKSGDKVIISGTQMLQDGMAVVPQA